MQATTTNALSNGVATRGIPECSICKWLKRQKFLPARIEAAHRRDIEAYDLIDFMSPVGRVKPAPVGNGAKMREALEQIRQKAIATIPGSSIQKRTLDKFRLLASDALAAPPRNCDVGAVRQQLGRFMKLCRSFPECAKCPYHRCVGLESCVIAWAQMPYEKGGRNERKLSADEVLRR